MPEPCRRESLAHDPRVEVVRCDEPTWHAHRRRSERAARLLSGSSAASGWPGEDAGGVSLTYDDGLESQLDLTVPALDQRGLRGTFFVTMENIRHHLPEWEAIVGRGHELADHTVDHPCDLRRFTPEEFAARELAPMEAWLDAVEPARRIRDYAYPCDVTNLGKGGPNRQARRYNRLLAEQGITAARTSEGGPNRPAAVLRRPFRLQALAVGYDARSVDAVVKYLSFAASHRRWAILVFHAIEPDAAKAGAVTSEMHMRILDAILALPLWCAPLGQVVDRLRQDAQALAILRSSSPRS